MTPEEYTIVGRAFDACLNGSDVEQRRILDELAGEFPDLCDEVAALLKHARAGAEADATTVASETPLPTSDFLVGQKVGSYTILRLLATGGMGQVYVAEQEQPRRLVAIKVLRHDSMSESMWRRFQQECEILGNLNHRGIARVIESGTYAQNGQVYPFYAMELVIDAQTLVEYANTHRLQPRDRLRLMIEVCDAVHEGHLNGFMHRDLKPANILVDKSGQPKVIDFGVARVTNADISLTTMETAAGALIGTLAYMSPEQCGGDPVAIDARTDVYSLGVILYELMSGQRPYDVSHKLLPDAIRIIREEEPSRLSTISSALRGDIETIVGKAIEKERDRRYSSAAALAEDIRRFLDDEPIAARPPSPWYQLSKFTKRNKAIVGGAVAVMLVMVGGSATTVIQAVAKQRAAEQFTAMYGLLEDQILIVTPNEARGANVEGLVYGLNELVGQLDKVLDGMPMLKAEILVKAAASYNSLSEPHRSLRAVGRALQELEGLPKNAKTREVGLQAQFVKAKTLHASDRVELGWPILQDVIEARRDEWSVDDPRFKDLFLEATVVRADAAIRMKDHKAMRLVLADARSHVNGLKHDGRALSIAQNIEIILLSKLGEHDEALRLAEASLARRRNQLEERDPQLLKARTNVANVKYEAGDFEGAIAIQQDVVAEAFTVATRAAYIMYQTRLSNMMLDADREDPGKWRDDVLAVSALMLASVQASGGRPNQNIVCGGYVHRAEVLVHAGRHEEAEATLQRWLGEYQRSRLRDTSDVARARRELARIIEFRVIAEGDAQREGTTPRALRERNLGYARALMETGAHNRALGILNEERESLVRGSHHTELIETELVTLMIAAYKAVGDEARRTQFEAELAELGG